MLNSLTLQKMKKYVPFLIGLLFALPMSALAYIVALPDFPDVNKDAWYADGVSHARQAGWLTGYGDGSFGPRNPVLRGELATILVRYDRTVEKMHNDLQNILCLNKGNSLNSLGLQVTDNEKYSQSMESFCGGLWPPSLECIVPYDAQTGEYQPELKLCP